MGTILGDAIEQVTDGRAVGELDFEPRPAREPREP